MGLNALTQFLFPNPVPGQVRIVQTVINVGGAFFNTVVADYVQYADGNGGAPNYWFNVNGIMMDPIGGGIEVIISSTDTAAAIATNLVGVINGSGFFSASDDGLGTVTVTAFYSGTFGYSGGGDFCEGQFTSTITQYESDPSDNGIASGSYITIYTPTWSGTAWTPPIPIYAWFNVSGNGNDPGLSPEVEVAIDAFDYGYQIVLNTANAINATFPGYFSAQQNAGINEVMNVQNTLAGVVTGPASSSGSIDVSLQQQGVNSDLQHTSINLSNGSLILLNTPSTNYFLNFSAGGFGDNITIAGRTRISVSNAFSATSAQVATQIKNAINIGAVGKMTAVSVSNLVTITNVANGPVTDISKQQIGAGTTVAVTQQGSN